MSGQGRKVLGKLGNMAVTRVKKETKWTKKVDNEVVLEIIKEYRNILKNTRSRKANRKIHCQRIVKKLSARIKEMEIRDRERCDFIVRIDLMV